MSQTVQQALRDGAETLRKSGIDGAMRDARLLMAARLCIDPGRVTLHLHDMLEPVMQTAFLSDIARRAARHPVSHILGYREFYGRRFAVTPDVLDPRPETETLVQAALAEPFADVLDLGTGSGAIVLTLLAERAGATGIGTDLSAAALSVAGRNAARLGLTDRCAFRLSDWCRDVAGRFDLIVSNPPYIAAGEMAGLSPELTHEPRMALTDDADGLTAYRRIAAQAPDHLRPGGRLMVEIGAAQGDAVRAIFARAGLTGLTVLPDLDGRDRVVFGRHAA